MQIAPTPITPPPERSDRMQRQAAEMEVAFLSQMLSLAGLNDSASSFGGGIGEGQFASFLRDEQARMIVDRGGIGLTERLFRAMGGQDGAN